ncbi:MAG TPA: transketolase [Pseudobdellovibrionaceae bacterium]|nr:transketolase [Pseudobdellovibrionaceae bacterium]
MSTIINTHDIAKKIRIRCLELCYKHKASHLGGAFSVADIITVLYFQYLNVDPSNPKFENRDRLFYSKGHACTSLYATLELKGFFKDLIENYTSNGSPITSHVSHKVPGIELSTGSLGHALPVSVGVALAGKHKKSSWRVLTIVSDGELDEGSNWESILFAPQKKLDNLTLIVDYNKIQSFGHTKDVIDLDPLGDKFKSFGWSVYEINGHDHFEIKKTLLELDSNTTQKPKVIIAHTIKGKGVSFMEGQLAWHYKSPNATELAQGIKEILES